MARTRSTSHNRSHMHLSLIWYKLYSEDCPPASSARQKRETVSIAQHQLTAPQRGDEQRPLTPPGRVKTTRQFSRPQHGAGFRCSSVPWFSSPWNALDSQRAAVHDLHPSPGAPSSHRPRQPSIVHRHVSGQQSASHALKSKLGGCGCSVAYCGPVC